MTRRLLLEMAFELFEQKGYAATTVDDIAVAVGTTRATFYAHFPSKGQLMLVLVARSNRILSEADVPPLRSVVASGDRFRSGSGSRANLISGPTSGRT